MVPTLPTWQRPDPSLSQQGRGEGVCWRRKGANRRRGKETKQYVESVDGCGRWRCAWIYQRHLGENGQEDGMEMNAEL